MRPVKFTKAVKTLKLFDIQIFGLKNKSYDFAFEVNRNFFEVLPDHDLFETGNCQVTAQLEKTERMLRLDLQIEGTIELTCDRSLEKFDFPIQTEEQLYYNYSVDEEQDSDDDNIFYISSTTESINIAHPIYELIGLEVPMRKIHPKYAQDDEEFFYSTAEIAEDEANADTENTDENEADSLADKLKDLQNRFNK